MSTVLSPGWTARPVSPAVRVHGSEAASLRLDGLVSAQLWHGDLAVDLGCGPSQRMGSLAALLPPGAVVTHAAAAWVHTGGRRPETLDVALPRRVRGSYRGLRPHFLRLAPEDVVVVAGRPLTSPLATAADLARALGRVSGDDDGARTALQALLASHVTHRDLVAVLSAERRRSGSTGALRFLRG